MVTHTSLFDALNLVPRAFSLSQGKGPGNKIVTRVRSKLHKRKTLLFHFVAAFCYSVTFLIDYSTDFGRGISRRGLR